MRASLALLALLCASAWAQAPAAQPSGKELLRNQHLAAFTLELPAQAAYVHPRDHDRLLVLLNDADYSDELPGGKPQRVKARAGAVIFQPAGSTDLVRNLGDAPLRALEVEFLERQGPERRAPRKRSRYCNPGSKTACVSEHYLFCTRGFCASEVEMGAGAITMLHSHATDHFVVTISPLDMRDQIEGKPAVHRLAPSGRLLYVPAGITHRLVNGPQPAHFITVEFR